MSLKSYSVAIRTLGTSPETLYKELVSIHAQSIAPKEIIIYIARGYQRPEFTVGREIYVEVNKGMVSQRALDYKEISTEHILLLDDDVLLHPRSAQILLEQIHKCNGDCVAADTFANHEMSVISKIKAIIGNLVFPRFTQDWAFKLHPNGSFSYLNKIKQDIYPSQTAAGPCSLWKKKSLLALRFQDEKWLDRFGFAFGDDDLEFFKLHINGGRLFVSFTAGVTNLDSKSASALFQQNEHKFYIRSMSNFIRWYRMQYEPRQNLKRTFAMLSFGLKMSWLTCIHLAISALSFNVKPLFFFINGLSHGISFVRSKEYKNIPCYKNENIVLN